MWLENYLSKFKKILLLVSHSQDFMNNVCTQTIHMHKRRLDEYGGNYDTVRACGSECSFLYQLLAFARRSCCFVTVTCWRIVRRRVLVSVCANTE